VQQLFLKIWKHGKLEAMHIIDVTLGI
jgi:hypothetical protein